MNQLTGRQGGHITILTDVEFTVNGNQVNGFKVDLNTMKLTPTYNGVKADADLPLKPQANTVEYAIVLRDNSDTEVARSGITSTF